jgi:AmmeMemoRadiSam system protein B
MSPESPFDPSPRPGRIIIPGAEPEPQEAPRIVTPSGSAIEVDREPEPETPHIVLPPGAGAPESQEPSRIVLPPGASLEEDRGAVPEYPRLRPLVLMPFRDGQRDVILVNDPLGVIPGQPVLGIEALPLLELLDGSVSINDLTAALMRESKDLRVASMVRDFVAQLDELLMLDSPRFEAAWRALRDAYHPLEIRPAALAGRSYPADPAELTRTLETHFAAAEKMRAEAGDPVAGPIARPRALLAPHLDPRRAGPAIARAYLELGPEQPAPLRVVIFGTGHSLFGDPLALTRKHFETPLGLVKCDTAFVDAVAEKLGEVAYRSELAHREEHSIEFQVLYLRHRLGSRPFTIVPILCGGFHALLDQEKTPEEDAAMATLVSAVAEAERTLGGATIHVAGVDFSHVGPRFGDPALDERTSEEIEQKDRDAIDAARSGDPDRWFRSIAAHDDSTRICGFAPTWAMLKTAGPGTGRLLRYEASDEKDGSRVTVASIAWP